MANNKFGYPDRWDGSAAFQSTLYPDSWTAAHAARKERKSNSMPYDDEAKPLAIPAFVVAATEIVRNLARNSKRTAKGVPGISTRPMPANIRTTGANIHPLGERSVNKRTAATQLPENESFKRPKLEASSQADLIDLTQDENAPPARRPKSNVSRHVAANGHRLNRLNPQQRAAEVYQAEAIAAGTGELLKGVVARLKTSVMSIDADRDALRRRWEIDRRLQLLTITDHLKVLNDCFARTEEGLRGSVEVIERFIM